MGKFSDSILNKTLEEITINDLKEFFSEPKDETATLEFKSGDVDVIKLYKEIAAFLNTEGGLLIVGAPRETKISLGSGKLVSRCQEN
jgi:predicted HTH transcriptional regulator